ncbi:MAG: aminotransferase [Cardiobacteriales bacterium]|nr:MAG: aminotransferase [Cardiobacteriales bacterium]
MTKELAEFSVVYTERALNHMTDKFGQVMRDLSSILTQAYHAHQAIVLPGSGTYAMEAVARQFLNPSSSSLIIRNGWFSYRWSQIIEQGRLGKSSTVLSAVANSDEKYATYSPAPLQQVIDAINAEKPEVVFAPHVDTSAGIRLQDYYTRTIAETVHKNGGLFALDCIASGADWLNMQALGIDILISAPQKGWSAPAGAGFVMLSEAAANKLAISKSSSFAMNLKQWQSIMQAYLAGRHAYHATMPTDTLLQCRDNMQECYRYGLDKLAKAQLKLGEEIRLLLIEKDFPSVAGKGWKSSAVIVSYTDDENIHNGRTFKEHGMQIAAGVPLACGEREDFSTFRIGLFGIDKLFDIDMTIARFKAILDAIKPI